MKYSQVVPAVFLRRPNRFIAHVVLDGQEIVVHVKNTGRCRELLIPGTTVYLARGENPARKTPYDLIAVRKGNGLLINMDSQAPNRAAAEWLAGQGYDRIVPEYRYGESRMDFYLERAGMQTLLEIKGCTLEKDGVGYFPDAPTERGTRHIHELIRAVGEGYRACLAFVIQMDGIREVLPNRETDPAFADALAEAERAGVEIWRLCCHVEPDELVIVEQAE